MRAFHFLTLSALVIGIVGTSVFAEDLTPPTWRGDAGSTYQAWEFDTNATPVAPNVVDNSYGEPVATIADATWFPFDVSAPDHLGIWHVGATPMSFLIPNTENTAPESYKEIWIQVTFAAENDLAPFVFTDPFWSNAEVVAQNELDELYWHVTYLITIEPNPTEETIDLIPRGCVLAIDEVVIDTRCIPEPMTLTLLACGGLALLRTRR